MHRSTLYSLIAAVVVVALFGAVTGYALANRDDRGHLLQRSPAATTTSKVTVPTDTQFERPGRAGRPYDTFLAEATADIEAMWHQQYPKVYGGQYTDLRQGLWAIQQRTVGPGCDGSATTLEEVSGNAFYCPSGDFIAWDDVVLFPSLSDAFGDISLGIVLAHEWGHAIQARAGQVNQPSVYRELQADCFAGAWLGRIHDQGKDLLKLTEDELSKALAAILQLRDQPGTAPSNPAAHGSAFDRVGALQDGYANGLSRCAKYPQSPPEVFQTPFSSLGDLATGGNLPLNQIFPAVVDDLNTYWSQTLTARGKQFTAPDLTTFRQGGQQPPACPNVSPDKETFDNRIVTCPDGRRITVDQSLLVGAEQVGDMAVGTLLGMAYATAASEQGGFARSGADGSLLSACGAGAWTKDLIDHPRPNLQLSPGDLDEAISAVLSYRTVAPDAKTAVAPAFDRVASYRTGVTQGLSTCLSSR